MEHLPSNFGKAVSLTDFSQQGSGPGPGQLWDPQRPYTPYHGKDPLFVVGGSMRESGKGPFSEYRQDCSNSSFWNNAMDVTPQPSYDYGPGGQGGK